MPPPEFSEPSFSSDGDTFAPYLERKWTERQGLLTRTDHPPSPACTTGEIADHNMSVQLPSEGNVSEKSGGLGESSDPELFKNILGCLQETA